MAISARRLMISSMLATFALITFGGKVRIPLSRRALAAASSGHGPFSF